MKQITKEELIVLIDVAFEATQTSKAGKVEIEENGKLAIRHVGFQTFMAVLSALLPKNYGSTVEIKEPPEPWQQP